jgi:hypothetical protein
MRWRQTFFRHLGDIPVEFADLRVGPRKLLPRPAHARLVPVASAPRRPSNDCVTPAPCCRATPLRTMPWPPWCRTRDRSNRMGALAPARCLPQGGMGCRPCLEKQGRWGERLKISAPPKLDRRAQPCPYLLLPTNKIPGGGHKLPPNRHPPDGHLAPMISCRD